MIRLGLCCAFCSEPIKFANTTATATGRLSRDAALRKLADLCITNANALLAALKFCHNRDIGAFRINSQILPLKTHPVCGYNMDELPDGAEIVRRFRSCGEFARQHGIRLSFHPDQFVVLNSKQPAVVEASLREIEYQAEVAGWVHADVVNIHGGGAYGDKEAALAAFAKNFRKLSKSARSLLTLENDDKIFTPSDLLPLCKSENIPLVYDVHHHRCNPDGRTVEEATESALSTWNREPLFHLSSPLEGWSGPKPQRHHDFIDIKDLPKCWRPLDITVEVEAKAKELAVLKLKGELSQGSSRMS